MLLQAGQQVLDGAAALARQMVAAAFAAGNLDVLWWSGAGAICVAVALAAAGIRCVADEGHRRLRRSGRALGMSRTETRLLHDLLAVGHCRQWGTLFRNRAFLDAVLRSGRSALPRPAPGHRDAHLRRVAALLSIKAKIEAAGHAAVRSMSSCAAGTPVVLAPVLKPSIETRVLASLGDEMACALPKGRAGDAFLRRGMVVTVRRTTTAASAGGVAATVLGSSRVAGQAAVLIARRPGPPGVPRMQGRPRRCEVTPVTAASAPAPRADRGQRRSSALGTLVSLDDGCAGVRSVAPVGAGRLVKLEVELGRSARLPLYGKVVRSPRPGTGGGVMLVHLTGGSRSRVRDLYRFADESRPGAGRFGVRAWPA